jgi:hypothetical protein
VVSESEEVTDRSAHEEVSASTRQAFSGRETQPAAVSGCDPSEKVIARWQRLAKASRRFDAQTQTKQVAASDMVTSSSRTLSLVWPT